MKTDAGQFQEPLPFDIHLPMPIDQDVRHGRIAEQRLERPQTEDLMQHLVADLQLLRCRQQIWFVLDDREHRVPDLGPNPVVVDSRQHFQIDAVEQLVVQCELQFLALRIERRASRCVRETGERWCGNHFVPFVTGARNAFGIVRSAGGLADGNPASGVTTTISSDRAFVSERVRNSAPRTGMCENPGIRARFSITRSSSNPAITKLCPSASSTSVSILRVDSAGIRNPETVTPFAGSMVDTSGFTCSFTVPWPVICGRNDSRIPNSRYWTVTAPAADPPWTTGTGNSPPARKLASLPFVATRFGSARICNSPRACKSRITNPRFRSGRNAKMFRTSERLTPVDP